VHQKLVLCSAIFKNLKLNWLGESDVNLGHLGAFLSILRGHTGFGKSWKVLDFGQGVFQDLKSVGKFGFVTLAME
jgi:hypothetical protein